MSEKKKRGDVRYESNSDAARVAKMTGEGALNRGLSVPTGKELEPASKQCGNAASDS